MTDEWTEKFDRWWAESYGLAEQLNDGRTVRIVRRFAKAANVQERRLRYVEPRVTRWGRTVQPLPEATDGR